MNPEIRYYQKRLKEYRLCEIEARYMLHEAVGQVVAEGAENNPNNIHNLLFNDYMKEYFKIVAVMIKIESHLEKLQNNSFSFNIISSVKSFGCRVYRSAYEFVHNY